MNLFQRFLINYFESYPISYYNMSAILIYIRNVLPVCKICFIQILFSQEFTSNCTVYLFAKVVSFRFNSHRNLHQNVQLSMAAQSAGNDSFEIALKCDTKTILEPQFTNCTYISTDKLNMTLFGFDVQYRGQLKLEYCI